MRRHVMPVAVVAVLAATSCGDSASTGTTEPLVTTTAAVVTSTTSDGPVAATDAQIEIGYTGEGTTYTGDRRIIEGTATFTFTNDSDHAVVVGFFMYAPRFTTALARELAFLEEGEWGVPEGAPAIPYVEVEVDGLYGSDGFVEPGSHTWTQDLEPGTYIFDVGPEDFHVTGMWRASVLEVLPDDSA